MLTKEEEDYLKAFVALKKIENQILRETEVLDLFRSELQKTDDVENIKMKSAEQEAAIAKLESDRDAQEGILNDL